MAVTKKRLIVSNGHDDEELSSLARAAEAVLVAVQDGVYRLALRMLGDPADGEDAAQEILIIVLTHLGTYRGESALSTSV